MSETESERERMLRAGSTAGDLMCSVFILCVGVIVWEVAGGGREGDRENTGKNGF